MIESYQFTMVLQAETMTHGERREADERAARMAWTLADRWRAATRRTRSRLSGQRSGVAVPAPPQ
ncbi:MAG TPA: hypothetical protein VOB72_27195 [Candidatus Dormibacteraeota bacterium]|nr:hypothetical protein [Candidatus Dormibacteraeota bacterium]